MKIPRFYQDLGAYLKPGKALVIFGPRQVGKTTLLRDFLSQTDLKCKFVLGDNQRVQQALGVADQDRLSRYVAGFNLLAIDEAQRIPGIGLSLKILVDQVPGLRIIATGSSSFELAGQVGEPLTGRKRTLALYPISQIELRSLHNRYDLAQLLSELLVYGSYPEVVAATGYPEKGELLEQIASSYLLKDILEIDRPRNGKVLIDLLRLVAFQIGYEVSLNELARQLGVDVKTVSRYLYLLEQAFVLYELRGFSRNLRKEVTKKSKYFFYDNGIRNAVISNFNELSSRDDTGQLWENFLIMERLKKRSCQGPMANAYFWRTWDQQEVDLVEEREGKLFGYEFRWGGKARKVPRDWVGQYPEASYEVISQDNYLEFVGVAA